MCPTPQLTMLIHIDQASGVRNENKRLSGRTLDLGGGREEEEIKMIILGRGRLEELVLKSLEYINFQ